MIGIYKITKKSNGKSYVGQSNDINRRFDEHRYKKDLAIEQAIQKYGAAAFDFEILEECSLEELEGLHLYLQHYQENNTTYQRNPRKELQ